MTYYTARETLVFTIVSLSTLLAALFIFNKKSFSREEKLFGYFLVLNTLFEFIAWASTQVLGIKNNLPGLHLYTLLEFIFIAKFATESIKRLKGLPATIIIVVGSLFIIINSIWIQSIYTYNSISISAVKTFTIVMGILFFHQLLATKKYSIVNVRPSVYFFTGIFLNACTSIIWYMYSNKIILLDDIQSLQLGIIKHSASLVASAILFIGVLYAINRKKIKPSN